MSCRPTSLRSNSRSQFGLTVVEVLIAGGLSFLLLGIMFGLHGMSYRVWRQTDAKSEATGRLQASLEALKEDLRRAPFDSLLIGANGRSLSFLSCRGAGDQVLYTPEGQAIWDHWLIYYLADGNLLRKSLPWGAPPQNRVAPVPVAGSPAGLVGLLDGNGRVLNDSIEEFRVSNPNHTRLLKIELRTRDLKHARGLTIRSVVRPRN